HPADKLFAGSTFDFEINVTGSAEISGIGSGDILAVNVEEEAGEGESIEQRATGSGDMATTQRSRHVVDLCLVGRKPHQGFEVCNGPALIADEQRERPLGDRSGSIKARSFIRAGNSNSNFSSAGQESVGTKSIQDSQVELAVCTHVLTTLRADSERPTKRDICARTCKLSFFKSNF